MKKYFNNAEPVRQKKGSSQKDNCNNITHQLRILKIAWREEIIWIIVSRFDVHVKHFTQLKLNTNSSADYYTSKWKDIRIK